MSSINTISGSHFLFFARVLVHTVQSLFHVLTYGLASPLIAIDLSAHSYSLFTECSDCALALQLGTQTHVSRPPPALHRFLLFQELWTLLNLVDAPKFRNKDQFVEDYGDLQVSRRGGRGIERLTAHGKHWENSKQYCM